MRVSCYIFLSLFLILASSSLQSAFGQLGFDLKIDKPEPYDNRVLRAEKTTDKKLKGSKRFFQNLTTHYNYYFNASNKINEVIDGAKESFRDDYTDLLPFYNYKLDVTAQYKNDLDSVIYKSQTGIVMHDLRNDWVDNMYLLWGAAWFLEKKFDSAALMFQFINYSFAEKEKDGYYKYIGSRLDGNNALSVATDEKKKTTSHFGSRNNAFLWQIRTMIETGNYGEAGSLIATLKDDPFFPNRLNDDLEEIQAYWFYQQKIWDSSASHLINALDNAKTKQERARWEYLAAQMFEKANDYDQAQKFYTKSIAHTTDPVMDVYARLNVVRVTKDTSANYVDKNIAELLKMAKRDKYTDFRDVIYFMAAQMEMDRGNVDAAQELLLKGSKYNSGNLISKSKSFLQLADLLYNQKKYIQAASFYDSLNLAEFKDSDLERIQTRKPMLAKIVSYASTISRQDSLQKIAAMPEAERTAFLSKLAKKLRKEQGLTDVPTSGFAGNNPPPVDLFQSSQKGDWYFYNNSLKTLGASQFKQVWGNRPNVDNWRRFASVNKLASNQFGNNANIQNPDSQSHQNNAYLDNTPSAENLLKNIPLTPEQLKTSNDSIGNALFNLGTVLLNEAEDYLSAIDAFEKLRLHYPSYKNMEEVLFNLYYSYMKAGNQAEAEKIKKLLLSQYPSSRYANILTTGKDPLAKNAKSPETTKTYEDIYNMFIEGNFEQAEAAKKIADSTYKTNFWEPQLLYIEAVYHIRQRDDSVAKNILQTLIGQDPKSGMAQKAQNMIDVLNRRKQIEDELSRYQIQNKEDTAARKPFVTNPVVQKPVTQNPIVQNLRKKDTVTTKPNIVVAPRKDTTANKSVLSPPVKKDTSSKPGIVLNPPTSKDTSNKIAVSNPVKKDTAAKKPVVSKPASIYSFDSSSKHYAVIILDKVDPLFVTEVKNAYFRFNREHFGGRNFQMTIIDLDADKKMILVGDFANANDAANYMLSAKRFAPTEVIPWLKADKYSFTIITDANLPILIEKKDLVQYQKFLDQNLPGKF